MPRLQEKEKYHSIALVLATLLHSVSFQNIYALEDTGSEIEVKEA